MMPRTRQRARRRKVVIGLALIAVLTGACWLALRRIPAWYQPVVVLPKDEQRVRDNLTGLFTLISDQMIDGRPFNVSVPAVVVNEWIAARARIWPESAEWLPASLADPVIRFDGGRMTIGAHYQGRFWESIVGVRLLFVVDGDDLIVQPVSVSCGAVPIPLGLMYSSLPQRAEGETSGDLSSLIGRILNALRKGGLTRDGIRMRGPFIWANGRRPYRVESIHARDDVLQLRFDPL